MKPWTTTLTLVAVAALAAAAVFATRPATREAALLSDQGQPLAPALTDPLAVKSLEVFSFDKQAARVRAFKVAFDGARWVIPSHSNYPADAAAKVGAAASAFANLIKERVITDDKRDHARLGVLAPDDQALSGEGVGTRVTLTDASGKVLADLIIGNPLANDDAPAPGAAATVKRCIREASGTRVYATTFAAGFSTRFADWVQVDLLQLTADQAVGAFIDRYKIDQQAASISSQSQITLTRAAEAEESGERPWALSATEAGKPLPTVGSGAVADASAADGSGQRVSIQRMNEMLAALSGIKIVGVRPKPANLAKVLAAPDRGFKLGLTDQLSLQSRGFFLASDGRFVSTEGQMSVSTNEGVVYSLWFGEVVPDTEDAGTGSGSGRVGAPDADAAPEGTAPKPATGTSRYLMATASFDPLLLPEPAKPQDLLELEKLADEAAKPQPSSPAAAEGEAAPPTPPALDTKALEEKRAQHQAKIDLWKNQVESGKKRAEQLAKRFADWYYVIDAPSLDKIRPSRADLIEAVPPPPPPPSAPPAASTSPDEAPAPSPLVPPGS
ncbi:MAG: DUF4340 domain-containing protein [Phycisphaerales bacterium]